MNHKMTDSFLMTEKDVHVWINETPKSQIEVSAFEKYLSQDELVRASRFAILSAQWEFISARGMLRRLLGYYLGLSPQELKFQYTSHGKPILFFPEHISSFHFNVSHSKGLQLFVFSKNKIGVDIEFRDSSLLDFESIHAFMSASEKKRFMNLQKNLKVQSFFDIWVCKEAFAKAIGKGLSLDLSNIEIEFLPNLNPSIKSILNFSINDWQLYTPDVHQLYSAAVVVEKRDAQFLNVRVRKCFN